MDRREELCLTKVGEEADVGGNAGEEADEGVIIAAWSMTDSRTRTLKQKKVCCGRQPCSLEVGIEKKRL